MLTLVSFVVALGILIAVHEYGHYRVAVACGVKVLRFSVGFGKPLYTWRLKNKDTEFSIGMLPLGGYVKMLDEREAPVDPAERHLAFNTQPLQSRAAIVAAGPLANLLLAVLLYARGQLERRAGAQGGSGQPGGRFAGRAGRPARRRARPAGGFDGEELEAVRSFEDLRWRLTRGALDGRDLQLGAGRANRRPLEPRTVLLPLSQLDAADADAQLFQQNRHSRALDAAGDRRGHAGRRCRKSRLARRRCGPAHRRHGDRRRAAVARNHPRCQCRARARRCAADLADPARRASLCSCRSRPRSAGGRTVRSAASAPMWARRPRLVTVRYGPLDGLWQRRRAHLGSFGADAAR